MEKKEDSQNMLAMFLYLELDESFEIYLCKDVLVISTWIT